MAKKMDFGAKDSARYMGIIEKAEAPKEEKKEGDKREYTRLNPTKPETIPSEYKFTARMPGEYAKFINELAYQNRTSVTAEIQRLIAEEMKRRPDILEGLDELNKL